MFIFFREEFEVFTDMRNNIAQERKYVRAREKFEVLSDYRNIVLKKESMK